MIYVEDCFAYFKNGSHGRCKALDVKTCDGCHFYKSKEDYLKELEKYPPTDPKFGALLKR